MTSEQRAKLNRVMSDYGWAPVELPARGEPGTTKTWYERRFKKGLVHLAPDFSTEAVTVSYEWGYNNPEPETAVEVVKAIGVLSTWACNPEYTASKVATPV